MRNKKEFEEYVRALTEKKLEAKRERRVRMRRISFGIGGCAAGICVVLLALIYFEHGLSYGSGQAEDTGNAFSDEASEWKDWHLTDGWQDAEAATDPYQDKDYSYNCGIPEASKPEGADCDKSEPEYVMVYRDKAEFKLQKPENISSLAKELDSFELMGSTDTTDGEKLIVLEFVYAEKTVRYGFTEGSVEVSGFGDFSVSFEKVSELSSLLDSLIQSEQ